MRLTREGLLRINYRNVQMETERLICNFHCSYCIVNTPDRRRYDKQDLQRTERLWDMLDGIDDRIAVRINLDGETLIDPWAKAIAQDIAGRANVEVCEMITNNSIPPKEYLGMFPADKISFACSYHSECISLERFTNHLLELRAAGCPAFVYAVATPRLLLSMGEMKRHFNELGFSFRVEALMSEYQGRPYPESYSIEERHLLRALYESPEEYAFSVEAESPLGFPCYAGYDEITLFTDGCVSRCYEYPIGRLDEYILGHRKLSHHPERCESESCLCPAYHIYVKRFRDQHPLSKHFVDHYEGKRCPRNDLECTRESAEES
jgi:hypothetical protein